MEILDAKWKDFIQADTNSLYDKIDIIINPDKPGILWCWQVGLQSLNLAIMFLSWDAKP